MGKRKQTVPLKATEEKRKCLSWNMLENQPGSSNSQSELTLISDDDPRLKAEFEEAERLKKQSKQNISARSCQIAYADDEIAEIFNLHLENCLFRVSVLQKPKLKPGEWSCCLGEFTVTFLPESNVIPLPVGSLPEIEDFWLYVGVHRGKSLLYYEIVEEQEVVPQKSKKKKTPPKKKIVFWNVDISLPVETMEALKCNVFQVVVDEYDAKTLTIELKIVAPEAALSVLSFVSESERPKKQNRAIATLMDQFYGIKPPSYDDLTHSKKHDIDQLYSDIKARHVAEKHSILPNIQHPFFRPQLRLYQQEAISWMVEKEKQFVRLEDENKQTKSGNLHILYTEITTRDNKKLFYNRYGGLLVNKKPCSLRVPPAGILGDEMGLGKTVEVLGCMLHNPRENISRPEQLPILIDEVKCETKTKKKKAKKDGKKKEKMSKESEKVDTKTPVEEPDSDTGSTVIYSNYAQTETSANSDVKFKIEDVQNNQTNGTEKTLKTDSLDSSTNAMDCSQNANISQSVDKNAEIVYPGPSGLADDSTKLNNSETREVPISDAITERKEHLGDSDEASEPIESFVASVTDATKFLIGSEAKDVENGPGAMVQNDLLKEEVENSVDNTIEQIEADSFDEIKSLSNVDSVSKSNSQGKRKSESNVMKRKTPDSDSDRVQIEHKPGRNIFTEMPASQRECFECICGATEAAATKKDAKKHPVQCVKCSLWQHAECVNYDLRDVFRGEFMCPHCHVSSAAVASGATLIISPASIAHQWVEEILKHVVQASLNVFMYTGVYKQGFIQPQTLAQQDIVITTYETLRKEIDYVDLPHNNSASGRKLRYPKRFMAVPSPITAVEWWRICLDEAQMVECTTTKTAEMALRLSAVNRWCVTGTPIQKGVEDLYGLLLFLGIDPFWVQQWWNKLILEPFCYGIKKPMHDLLTSVLWRTMKKDVLDQINIPKQTEHINWLTFSPVEDHFYRRQYKECSRLAMERLSKFTERSTRLSKLDRYTINQLLYPLLRLRQACCHPQAVRGEFLPIHKSTMTMEQLLESLTKKAKLEAEESHRALVAAINGQAGLDIINQKGSSMFCCPVHDSDDDTVIAYNDRDMRKPVFSVSNQFVEAVEKYREVLRSVEEHKEQLHTDSLQQLHAMYNLKEILSSKPEGVDPTLRDDQLSTQIGELKDKYMAKAIAYVTSTGEALEPLQLDVKSYQQQLDEGTEWWLDVIEWVVERDQQDLLIEKVKDDLLDNRNPEINSIARGIRSVAGLEYVVETHLSSLNTAYEKVQEAMKGLSGQPSQGLINKTVECCLRPVAEILKTCPFCKSEELFEAYESKLFSFVDKGMVVNEGPGTSSQPQVNIKRQGTWADSEVEKALKSILAFAKNYRAAEELIEFGVAHIKLLDALKKEYKKLRTHWAGIKEHVSSFDELDMATTRLRVHLPDEPKPDTPQPNILEPSELGHHKLKLVSDKIVAEGELRKKLGQLLYLKNLEKSQMEGPGGENPEPCPICQQELGKEWSVMQCGHCFCIECIRIVVDRYSFGGRHRTVKCAVCRQSSLHAEISYVTTSGGHSSEDEAALRVKGSHSTKVEAVVRCLLRIKRDDPTAKALVFSTWVDVLSVIATALSENGVNHRALYTPGKFQANLTSFKQDEDVTALLLPVHSGANGLNLIEATYVLLVEPVLNPAQELQAIGRVHRIGQTKPTQVHRFLIRSTIEQKMQSLLESMDVKATTKNAEENALTIGDLVSLFTQAEAQEDPPIPEVDTHDQVGHDDSSSVGRASSVELENIVENVEISTDCISETDAETHDWEQAINISRESPVELEDIVENVEISTDCISETGVDANNLEQGVNIDEPNETGNENNDSDVEIISPSENDSDSEMNDRYSFYGEDSDCERYNSEYESDDEFNRYSDERYSDEDEDDRLHSDIDDTSETVNMDTEAADNLSNLIVYVDDDNYQTLQRQVVGHDAPQPEVEVDDMIAMHEVDTFVVSDNYNSELANNNGDVNEANSEIELPENVEKSGEESVNRKTETEDYKPATCIEIVSEDGNESTHPNKIDMSIPIIEIKDDNDHTGMPVSVIEIKDEDDDACMLVSGIDIKDEDDDNGMLVPATEIKDDDDDTGMPVSVIKIKDENDDACMMVPATEIKDEDDDIESPVPVIEVKDDGEAECIIIDDAIDRPETAIEALDEVDTVVDCTSANIVKLQGEVESDIACTVDNDIQ